MTTSDSSGGRTKLTDEVQAKVVDAISKGNFICVACRYAGIGRTTYYTWMRRGRDERLDPYRSFYEEVRRAEAEAEVQAVAAITREMEGNWRAALAFLERKFPDRWGGPSQRTRRRDLANQAPKEVRLDEPEAFLDSVARILEHASAGHAGAAPAADSSADERHPDPPDAQASGDAGAR